MIGRGWSARYLAYARSQGLEPDAVMKRDEKAARGDAMGPFRSWARARWAEYRGVLDVGEMPPDEHAAFDRWLEAQHEPKPTGQVPLFGGG